MSKFTPGPWVVRYQGKLEYPTAIQSQSMPTWEMIYPKTSSDGQHVDICTFRFADDSDFSAEGARLLTEINRANAALISAAPEMLEALQAAVSAIVELTDYIEGLSNTSRSMNTALRHDDAIREAVRPSFQPDRIDLIRSAIAKAKGELK